MQIITDRPQAPTAIRTDLGAIFVSLELSRSTWLITSLSPGGGEKMSKHTVSSGDVAGLWTRFSQLKDKVQVRTGQVVPIIVIQEAGLDGFWIHRLLQDEGVESHVVDPASIATSRRRRRAKTDKIDGEALVRALLAYDGSACAWHPHSHGSCSRRSSYLASWSSVHPCLSAGFARDSSASPLVSCRPSRPHSLLGYYVAWGPARSWHQLSGRHGQCSPAPPNAG